MKNLSAGDTYCKIMLLFLLSLFVIACESPAVEGVRKERHTDDYPEQVSNAYSSPLIKKAKALEQQHQFEAALGIYQKAIETYQTKQEWETYFLAICEREELHFRLGNYTPIPIALEETLSVYHKVLTDSSTLALGELYLSLGKFNNTIGQYDLSFEYNQKAVQVFEQINRPEKAAMAKLVLAWLYNRRKDADQGMIVLQQALDTLLQKEAENGAAIGQCLLSFARMQRNRYYFDSAKEYCEQSLTYATEARDTSTIAYAYLYLGDIMSSEHDYQNALEYCSKALYLLENYYGKESLKLSFTYQMFSLVYAHWGKYEKAYKYAIIAFERRRKLLGDDHPFVPGLLMNAGIDLQEMGDFRRAIATYEEVIELQKKVKQPNYDHYKIHVNIGTAYLGLKDTLAARQKLLDAHAAAQLYIDPTSLLWVTLYLDLARTAPNNMMAEAYSQQAFQRIFPEKESLLALDEKDFPFMVDKRKFFAVVQAQSKYALKRYEITKDLADLARARQLVNKVIDITDYICKNQESEAAKLDFLQLARENLEAGLYIGQLLYRQQPTHEVLYWIFGLMEKHKALLLIEAISNKNIQANLGIPTHLLEEEQALKAAIKKTRKQVMDESGDPDVDSTQLRSEIFELNQKLLSLQDTITQAYPAYQELRNAYSDISPTDLQKRLPDLQTALVEYSLNENRLTTFAITADTMVYHYQQLDSTFFGSLSDFRNLISEVQSAESDVVKVAKRETYVDAAHQLYRLLLAPILQELPAVNQLIVIPDGSLHYLPFEMLLTKTESAASYRNLAYLFKTYSIRYEFSAKILLETNQSSAENKGKLLAVAPQFGDDDVGLLTSRGEVDSIIFKRSFPSIREGMQPLQHNIPEVEQIKADMGGKVLTGSSATKTAFQAAVDKYDIIHLATHAYTNDLHPDYSYLVFATDEQPSESHRLYTYEIYGMRLTAQLAVLSACETGVGKLQGGEGVMSLSRAFKYAGCPNIVTSLWEADDKSTKDLIVNFYSNLKAGMGKADALRKAKLDFLATAEERYTHPFYWGTFILIGDNLSVHLQEPTFSFWNWIIGLALLSLILFWGWKKLAMRAS